jgi:magnesium-transporting ATPase (P-type)
MINLLFKDFGAVIKDVAIALAPLIVVFILFQIFMLKLPRREVIKIIKGVILTFVGLTLFLQGVHVGFMPVGELMGMVIGATDYNWILIPIGFLLGFSVIMAEPAVQVLTKEVEKASGGHVNRNVMLYTVCIGVALSVSISMIRVITGTATA